MLRLQVHLLLLRRRLLPVGLRFGLPAERREHGSPHGKRGRGGHGRAPGYERGCRCQARGTPRASLRDASGGSAPTSCQVPGEGDGCPVPVLSPRSGVCARTCRAVLPLRGGEQDAETPAEAGWWPHCSAPRRVTLRPRSPLGPHLGPGLSRQDRRAGRTGITSRPLSGVPTGRRAHVLCTRPNGCTSLSTTRAPAPRRPSHPGLPPSWLPAAARHLSPGPRSLPAHGVALQGQEGGSQTRDL